MSVETEEAKKQVERNACVGKLPGKRGAAGGGNCRLNKKIGSCSEDDCVDKKEEITARGKAVKSRR